MLKARGAYQLRLSRGYANHNNCLLPADGSVAVAWTCTIARSKAAAQASRRTSLGRARALTDTQQGRPPVGGTASLRRRIHGDIDTANTGSIKPNCFSSPLRIDPVKIPLKIANVTKYFIFFNPNQEKILCMHASWWVAEDEL